MAVTTTSIRVLNTVRIDDSVPASRRVRAESTIVGARDEM
jgi:hypothetical protein